MGSRIYIERRRTFKTSELTKDLLKLLNEDENLEEDVISLNFLFSTSLKYSYFFIEWLSDNLEFYNGELDYQLITREEFNKLKIDIESVLNKDLIEIRKVFVGIQEYKELEEINAYLLELLKITDEALTYPDEENSFYIPIIER